MSESDQELGPMRRRARTGRRAARIASLMARHGLGYVAEVAGLQLPQLPGRSEEEKAARPTKADAAGRIVAAAAEAGPVFVRLAQHVALRIDVLGRATSAQLASAVVAEETDDQPDGVLPVFATLAEQLGAPVESVFSHFAPEPSAVTPTAWVHAARLVEGVDVVVAIRRPGLVAMVEEDLTVLAPAARMLNRRQETGDGIDFEAECERFAAQLRSEVDLQATARELEAIRHSSGSAGMVLPLVVRERSTPGVLVAIPPEGASAPESAAAVAEALLAHFRTTRTAAVGLASAIHQPDPNGPAVLTGALRTAVVAPEAIAAFAALAEASGARDIDAVVAVLEGASAAGAGKPVASLRIAVRTILDQPPIGIGARVAALLEAAGDAGLVLTGDLCLVTAFAEELRRVCLAIGEIDVDAAIRRALPAAVARPAVNANRAVVRPATERSDGEPVIGFALSGGAARGAAHSGVVSALLAAGIRPDVIAGTSAGAIVGALMAAGTAAAQVERIIAGMRWSTFARPVPSRLGLVDTGPLEAFLDDTLGKLHFEDLLCPLAVVATDLGTGSRVVLDQGRLAPAVRASASMPGIFPPVDIDGRVLIDGGIVDNLPIDVAYSLGADYVVAIDVSAPMANQRPGNVIDVMLMTVSILTHQQEHDRMAPDAAIRVELGEFSGWSASDVAAMFEAGRQAAEAVIPAVLDGIAALRSSPAQSRLSS